MHIIAVDDERIALENLTEAIRAAMPHADIKAFRAGEEALTHSLSSPVDVAFLDITMRGIDGIETAKRIKIAHPGANIIFTTGYSEYMSDAFRLHASGYLMKPITQEMVAAELADLRNPVQDGSDKRVRIQAFGNFEVFLDGEPMHFQYNKTRELLAWLVDRNGAMTTNGEIMAALWEDDEGGEHNSYLKNIRADLINTLEENGCGDILTRQRGKLGIVPDAVSCDYFAWLRGEAWALNAYHGEYMTQYSWGEYTLGVIEQS